MNTDNQWVPMNTDNQPIGIGIDNVNFKQPRIVGVGGKLFDMNIIAERYGYPKVGDILSISGHLNAKGEWVPDYDTVKIERQAE